MILHNEPQILLHMPYVGEPYSESPRVRDTLESVQTQCLLLCFVKALKKNFCYMKEIQNQIADSRSKKKWSRCVFPPLDASYSGNLGRISLVEVSQLFQVRLDWLLGIPDANALACGITLGSPVLLLSFSLIHSFSNHRVCWPAGRGPPIVENTIWTLCISCPG
jgi:hypothetical protein